ncbi:MAG: hypothetical protein Q7V58_05810 [Actinomycetota bacterium]|nr:hypothetical protein [Actinomycetota bacterium]
MHFGRGRRAVIVLAATVSLLSLAACSEGSTSPSGTASASSPAPVASADADAPEGWLPGLPVPTGAEIITMAALDSKNINSIWRSTATPDEAAAAYGAQLAEAGIVSQVSVTSDEMTTTDYAGAGFTVNVVTTGEGGATGLLINASRE